MCRPWIDFAFNEFAKASHLAKALEFDLLVGKLNARDSLVLRDCALDEVKIRLCPCHLTKNLSKNIENVNISCVHPLTFVFPW